MVFGSLTVYIFFSRTYALDLQVQGPSSKERGNSIKSYVTPAKMCHFKSLHPKPMRIWPVLRPVKYRDMWCRADKNLPSKFVPKPKTLSIESDPAGT